MRASLSLIATLSLLAAECSGHYIFQQLSIGSTKYPVYQHIRRNTNYNSPVTSRQLFSHKAATWRPNG